MTTSQKLSTSRAEKISEQVQNAVEYVFFEDRHLKRWVSGAITPTYKHESSDLYTMVQKPVVEKYEAAKNEMISAAYAYYNGTSQSKGLLNNKTNDFIRITAELLDLPEDKVRDAPHPRGEKNFAAYIEEMLENQLAPKAAKVKRNPKQDTAPSR